MNIAGRALICAMFYTASVPANAEPDSTQSQFILPSGTIPSEIFGNACVSREGNADFAPMLICRPEEILKRPSISVSVADSKCEATREQLAANMREAFHESALFRVVWEESFAAPGVPDGVGIRGFYQTNLGNRYVWSLCGSGKLTRVIVQMFSPTDNEALKADIETKVFGIKPTDSEKRQGMTQ